MRTPETQSGSHVKRRPKPGVNGSPALRSRQALRERVKELGALHSAAQLLVESDDDAAAILRSLAELLAAAFQFPETASACISIGEVDGRTPAFAPSRWVLSKSFTTTAGVSGSVKVSYAEERPPAAEGPFLAEERSLLNTMARLVCAAFEHRAVRAALRESEEQLRRLAESIDDVYWLYDWESGEHIYLNGAFEKVWGRKVKSGADTARVFLASTLPEDRPAVDGFLDQQRRQLPCEVRYRIRRPDGTVRWIYDRAFPIRDPHGRAYRTAGIAKDITDTHEAAAQSNGSAARLALLTRRQREVLQLLAEGKSVKEAAFLLQRSPKTVETHKAELMQRLELPDLAALVRFAMRYGLVR